MAYQEPEFLPWDGRRVPLTFIGGYLGAGKTTLVNEVLARTDRPVAVVVNDVGEINIDAALIRRRSGDTIELTDGCVCCSLVDGFGAAFDQIRARPVAPDQVIVELSGAAIPDRVRPWGNSAGFRLDGVVVLFDTEQLADQLADPIIGERVRAQLGSADVVIATKLDLVDEAAGRRAVEAALELAPGALAVPVERVTDAASLIGLGGRRPGGIDDVPAPSLFDPHRTRVVPLERGLTEAQVVAVVDGLGDRVVRAKGIAELADGRRVLVQRVGRRIACHDLPAPERVDPSGLVVIDVESAVISSAAGC